MSTINAILLDSAGTNKATIDSAGNQTVKGSFVEQSGLSAGSLNADLVASTDVSAYRWFSIQIAGVWVGTVTVQGCNDNVNWQTLEVNQSSDNFSLVATMGGTGLYHGALVFRYLRIRMTSYTSGTATGTLELYTVPAAFHTVGAQCFQGGNWTVLPGNTPNTTAWFANAVGTSGGTSDFHLISAASTNATSIKGSAGQVYGYDIYNANAAARYVKLYNKASAPTVGTDTPLRTIGIAPNSRASGTFPNGLAMGTGIALATTTGIADGDSAAVGASDLSIDIDYK